MEIGEATKLYALDSLSNLFLSPPASMDIHIVVQLPPIGEFSLFYLLPAWLYAFSGYAFET